MSESTAVLDAPVSLVKETPVVETPAPVELPAIFSQNDDRVKLADAMSRFAELYALGTSQPSLRAELDTRAFHQWVRALGVKQTDDTIHAITIDLPRYDGKGPKVDGSKRYVPQRAQIAAAVVVANGGDFEIFRTGYAYPNVNSKRKAHTVKVWATRADLDRIVLMYELITARAISDAYHGEHNAPLGTVFPPAVVSAPSQQTKLRRKWMVDFAADVDATMGNVTPEKAQAALALRQERAAAVKAEFVAENTAANADRSEERQVEVDREVLTQQ